MRFSLSVDPRSKTMSEVATIEYVRHHTDIPAPQVFRGQASNSNKLGFEWMLMARVPGNKLHDQWSNGRI
jgi:aminoglycoside phosphotransferase (APT) family kinase protein